MPRNNRHCRAKRPPVRVDRCVRREPAQPLDVCSWSRRPNRSPGLLQVEPSTVEQPAEYRDDSTSSSARTSADVAAIADEPPSAAHDGAAG